MVAIPEGLPVAVSIAMALSVNNLKKDNILIKNLEAIQTCATLHDICVGKTGTLTTGEMRVSKFHFCDHQKSLYNSKPDSFNEEESIHSQLKDLIKEAIVSNTDVRIENNDNTLKS
jgi:P-type E1-E2 ATPase